MQISLKQTWQLTQRAKDFQLINTKLPVHVIKMNNKRKINRLEKNTVSFFLHFFVFVVFCWTTSNISAYQSASDFRLSLRLPVFPISLCVSGLCMHCNCAIIVTMDTIFLKQTKISVCLLTLTPDFDTACFRFGNSCALIFEKQHSCLFLVTS